MQNWANTCVVARGSVGPVLVPWLRIALLTHSVIAGLAFASCSKEPSDKRIHKEMLHRAILDAGTGYGVSLALSQAKIDSCEELLVGLNSLGEAAQREESLHVHIDALIQELVGQSATSCSANKALTLLKKSQKNLSTRLAMSHLATKESEKLSLLGPVEAASPPWGQELLLVRRAELLLAGAQESKALAELVSFCKEAKTQSSCLFAVELALHLEHFEFLTQLGTVPIDSFSEKEQADMRAGAIVGLIANNRLLLAKKKWDLMPLHRRAGLAVKIVESVLGADEKVAIGGAESESWLRRCPEILHALALQSEGGERVQLLKRLVQEVPDDASHRMDLAEELEKKGDKAAAIEHWDKTASLLPGLDRAVLVPIRLLQQLGRQQEAKARVEALINKAVSASDYRLASFGAKYAQLPARAVTLAAKAVTYAPNDGRYQQEFAMRYLEDGDETEAARVLIKLLGCGSHGQAWHRHDLLARLSKIRSTEEISKAIEKLPCELVDAEGLRREIHSNEPVHKH